MSSEWLAGTQLVETSFTLDVRLKRRVRPKSEEEQALNKLI